MLYHEADRWVVARLIGGAPVPDPRNDRTDARDGGAASRLPKEPHVVRIPGHADHVAYLDHQVAGSVGQA